MKKYISIALALTMVLALFAGCGSSKAPAETQAPAANAPAAAETQAPTEAPAEAAAVKIGFIFLHDENSTYDLNFMNAAKEACDKLGVESLMRTNIPESSACYEAAADLVDAGCNVVFADSFGHEPYMIQAAQEFPEVQFCHATGTQAHVLGLDNYHNAFASIYEGRYLAGVAAGLKLNEMIEAGDFSAEEAKMGYVGAFTYAEVVSGYTSFYLGAKSVCPTVTMDVTFTGSWYDETAEKEAAIKLIDGGCKLISQHADSMGAPTACENAGVPNVSYNGSTVAACPNTFIVSSRINWAPYFELIINAVANGEDIPTDYVGTIETGSVELSEVNETAAAAGTAEKIAEVMAALMDGSVKVFDLSTFTVRDETLETFAPQAATDDSFDAATCVTVVDGAIVESGYRSAPYFDMQIDGINLLDTKF